MLTGIIVALLEWAIKNGVVEASHLISIGVDKLIENHKLAVNQDKIQQDFKSGASQSEIDKDAGIAINNGR